jgi:hypothetical protein
LFEAIEPPPLLAHFDQHLITGGLFNWAGKYQQPNFAKFDVAANDWVWTQQIGMNVTLSYAENKQKYGMAMDLLQAVKV